MSLEMVPEEKIIDQSNNLIENEREYNFEEFSDLKKQIGKLVTKLKAAIEKEEYTTLIGDDASGRIPTLILKKITEKVTTKPIKTLFIAGGKGHYWETEKVENTENKLDDILDQIKGRVLFVTEYMSEGEGMVKMAEQLENKGIDFDIASVASGKNDKEYERNFEIFKRHGLIIGHEDALMGPAVYNEKEISGVFKELPMDAEAKRIPINRNYGRQIRNSRNDVNIVANEIMKEIWGEDIKKAA